MFRLPRPASLTAALQPNPLRERFPDPMNSDASDTEISTQQHRRDGTQVRGTMSRRRLMVSAGAMTGAALWGGRPALARQATPVASPVSMTRDWRGERWAGTWVAAMHAPSA